MRVYCNKLVIDFSAGPVILRGNGIPSDTLRYWLFQNNQVNGPYDPDELSQLPSFTAEALVCPEGRKGTSMGDWQRAGLLPELSLTLLKATQLTPAARSSGARSYGALPPEPTLRDLAALGSLQEKVSMLENTLTLLQSELRLKDTEISGLHVDLEAKSAASRELKAQLDSLEERVGKAQADLTGNLDKAVAAEKGVESTVENQGKSLNELSGSIDSLKAGVKEIEKLKEDLRGFEKFKKDEAQEMERLKDQLKALDRLKEEVKELEKRGPSGQLAPLASPAGAGPAAKAVSPPSAVPPPKPIGGGLAAPGVTGALPPPPKAIGSPLAPPSPPAKTPGSAGLPPVTSSLENLFPAVGAPKAAAPPGGATAPVVPPPPVTGTSAAEPPKGKALMIAAGIAAVALLGAGGYVYMGKGKPPAPKDPPIPMDQAPLPPPATPELPSPEQLEAVAKAGAIQMLKDWPAGAGGGVGAALEGALPPAGGLSPWMAEKIRDGSYQVNFYPAKTAQNPSPRPLEFEVDLLGKTVKGKNAAAAELLSPPKPAPAKKKVAVKPKPVENEGADLFDELGAPDSVPAAEPEAPPAMEAGDAGPEPAAEKPVRKPRRSRAKSKAKAAPEKPLSLDDLLLPGVPKPVGKKEGETPVPKDSPTKESSKASPEGSGEETEILDDLLNP